MRLTKMSRCGTRAVFDIAYHSTGLPIPVRDISARQEIPLRFLEQIFNKLKQADIVTGVRGARGGYMLAEKPNKITVRDVIKAMRESTDLVFCVDISTKCRRSKQCVTRLVWKEAAEKINKFFDSVSISDLCEKGKKIGIKRDVKHSFDYSI